MPLKFHDGYPQNCDHKESSRLFFICAAQHALSCTIILPGVQEMASEGSSRSVQYGAAWIQKNHLLQIFLCGSDVTNIPQKNMKGHVTLISVLLESKIQNVSALPSLFDNLC